VLNTPFYLEYDELHDARPERQAADAVRLNLLAC
jgi:hypothetical protein